MSEMLNGEKKMHAHSWGGKAGKCHTLSKKAHTHTDTLEHERGANQVYRGEATASGCFPGSPAGQKPQFNTEIMKKAFLSADLCGNMPHECSSHQGLLKTNW